LDGRYKAQGQRDTSGVSIEVLDAGVAVRERWLTANLCAGQRLAVDGRLHSYVEVQRFREFAKEQELELVELTQNPIDALWGAERPAVTSSQIFDYPTRFAGLTATEKCAQLREWLIGRRMDCHLLADPEDVAWLLNVRTDDSQRTIATSWQIVPVPLTRMLVEATGHTLWFVERSRLEPALAARLQGAVEVMDPGLFESVLKERTAGKVIGANLRRTSHCFADFAAKVGVLIYDPLV